MKQAHLAVHPEMSVSYWTPAMTPAARSVWSSGTLDDDTRAAVWDKFANGPEPVGYDPTIIPHVARRPDIRRIRRAAAEPVPAAGDARHRDDEGRRRDPALDTT